MDEQEKPMIRGTIAVVFWLLFTLLSFSILCRIAERQALKEGELKP
jgi:hypothetical protein